MKVHVLPGDAIAAGFNKTGIEGERLVFRECLVVGPVEADDVATFWDERAKFILSEYGEDEIAYHESVADEIERLRDIGPGDEVYLWFEYELFCSVNLWFCLSLLQGSGARIYRVEPPAHNEVDRWKGFGDLDASGLKQCWDTRRSLGQVDVELGARLWDAYRRKDHLDLQRTAASAGNIFPFVDEVCRAAIEIDDRPNKIVSEIVSTGLTDLTDVFREFSTRAGAYGFGDLQVQRLLDQADQSST